MWEPLLEQYGLPGFVIACLMVANARQYFANQKLVAQLKEALERRVEDFQEHADEFKDLVKEVERAIDLIIKVVKRNGF